MEVFKGLHCTDEERAVSDRKHHVFRNASELLVDLVDVGLHAFIEEGIYDVIGIVDAFVLHAGAADVGAVVARPRNHMDFGAVRFDHRDLLGARAFRHVDFALDAGAGAVGGDGIPCVAARILNAFSDADRLHVGDEASSAAVLEGQGRHGIVDLHEHAGLHLHGGPSETPRQASPSSAMNSR